jgi:dolichyl-phosphate-mannose--protein O-mannosyl transferase
MSHFEYVSVAIALIFALAVGRLLGGLSLSLTESRRYWVHTTWIVVLLLVSVMSWWFMWRGNEVTWTPIRFLWALSIPALLYVRAAVLLGRPGEEPGSFYDHFYKIRPLFFSLGLVVAG